MKFSQRDLHIISAYQGLVEEPIAKIADVAKKIDRIFASS